MLAQCLCGESQLPPHSSWLTRLARHRAVEVGLDGSAVRCTTITTRDVAIIASFLALNDPVATSGNKLKTGVHTSIAK